MYSLYNYVPVYHSHQPKKTSCTDSLNKKQQQQQQQQQHLRPACQHRPRVSEWVPEDLVTGMPQCNCLDSQGRPEAKLLKWGVVETHLKIVYVHILPQNLTWKNIFQTFIFGVSC